MFQKIKRSRKLIRKYHAEELPNKTQKLEKFVENKKAKNGNFENVYAEILLRKYTEREN